MSAKSYCRQLVMKKYLYVVIAVLMIFATFTGCSLLRSDSAKETGIQNEATVNKDQDKNSEEPQKKLEKITLYFGNSNADALIAEKRDVVLNNGDNLEKIVMEELIKGSKTKDLSPTIPKGTKLLSIETKDGICTVNLSREFVENHPGGSAGEIITLDSIVNSLTELEGIKKVQFLVEGAKREAFIHLELGQPLERDESMIRK